MCWFINLCSLCTLLYRRALAPQEIEFGDSTPENGDEGWSERHEDTSTSSGGGKLIWNEKYTRVEWEMGVGMKSRMRMRAEARGHVNKQWRQQSRERSARLINCRVQRVVQQYWCVRRGARGPRELLEADMESRARRCEARKRRKRRWRFHVGPMTGCWPPTASKIWPIDPMQWRSFEDVDFSTPALVLYRTLGPSGASAPQTR